MGHPECPLWNENVDHHPFQLTGNPPKCSQIFLAFRRWCRLDWDIEMENGPNAESYHAEARPDNIQGPSSLEDMYTWCEYPHSANGSRVKGGQLF